VPWGEPVLIISGGGDPLFQLVNPDNGNHPVRLLAGSESFSDFQKMSYHFVIITGTGPEMHAELIQALKASPQTRTILTKGYVSRLQQGEESWELLEYKNP